MASIVTKKLKSKTSYYISYRLPPDPAKHGKRVQTWIPVKSKQEALFWLDSVQEAERTQIVFEFPALPTTDAITSPYLLFERRTITVQELLEEFVQHQCQGEKPLWSASTLVSSEGIIRNYILPFIGQLQVSQISPIVLQNFYDDLLTRKAVKGHLQHREPKNISARTVRDVHKILRPAFKLALRKGYITLNPADSVELPRQNKHDRKVPTADDLQNILNCCNDKQLLLCICLMLGCTLRDSELCGLTWDSVEISSESIESGTASILVNKTLRRLDKAALTQVNNRDVIRVLPPIKAGTKSARVLKSTKTEKSSRRVYLPNFVANLLIEHKATQDQQKALLGDQYIDYGFVIAQPDGNPYLCQSLSNQFKKMLKRHNLPSFDFYSLRHASATLKMSGTKDVKAVQSDLGHATSDMSMKIYLQVTNEGQKATAAAVEDRIFSTLKTDTSNS